MRITLLSGLAALAAGTLLVPAMAQSSGGNPALGRTIFARCAACHAVTPGGKRLGPSLAGVVGRKAGSEPDYAYSPAMRSAKIVWDARNLDAYLTHPTATVPGTKMSFVGIASPADRANLIAYLNTVH